MTGGDGGGWDWPVLAACAAGVCVVLGLAIFAAEIGGAVKKRRRR